MKQITAFQAFDGTLHATEEDCRAHEFKDPKQALVGLTVADIEKALTRDDVARADAIENLAYEIRKKRLAAGEKRRGGKSAEAFAPLPDGRSIPVEVSVNG